MIAWLFLRAPMRLTSEGPLTLADIGETAAGGAELLRAALDAHELRFDAGGRDQIGRWNPLEHGAEDVRARCRELTRSGEHARCSSCEEDLWTEHVEAAAEEGVREARAWDPQDETFNYRRDGRPEV